MSFWERNVKYDWLVVWHVVDITGRGVDEDGPAIGPHPVSLVDVAVDVVLGPDALLHSVQQVDAAGADAGGAAVAVPDGRRVRHEDVGALGNLEVLGSFGCRYGFPLP